MSLSRPACSVRIAVKEPQGKRQDVGSSLHEPRSRRSARLHTTSQEGNGQRAESAAQLRRHGTKEGFQPGVLVHKHKREGLLDNPDGELVLNSQFVELVPLELGQHGGLEKTCNVRMAGKEKESIKSKGKQRRVGEMAIRWIAIVQKIRCPVRVVPTAHTPLARSSNK